MIENVRHPGGGRDADQFEPSVSDVHAALSSERRRTALAVVAGATLPIDAATLARAVAAREERVPPDAVPRARVDEVHVALYHVHLPKLADCGLVQLGDDGAVEGVVDGFESVL